VPVLLHHSTDLPSLDSEWTWFAITGASPNLDPRYKLPNLGKRLEETFDGVRDDWWELGHKLGQTPSARIAHMPTAAAYNCDFGLMMAWTKLTEAVASSPDRCLVVCDDPWVFRQLATLHGVEAGRVPPLFLRSIKCWIRGWLARGKLVISVIAAHIRLRKLRTNSVKGAPTLLVYGHPGSTAEGNDAYFGSLMNDMPALSRMIHTDADVNLTLKLAKDGKTAGLHAWGSVLFAPSLFFQRWQPGPGDLVGPYSWILRRAVKFENATASPAANHWQMHCQERWLKIQRPKTVVWPWENHPWEREFCRSAKRYLVNTRGYQHAVIGPHQFNPGPASNPDGLASVPDRIICSGPAYHDQLLTWGIPADRLCIGGAFRISRFDGNYYDADGPVFVATSSFASITEQMMLAVKFADKMDRKFIVKIHPLYPQNIKETKNISLTNNAIPNQHGLSAVFYATGTSGLEGLLAGVPTFRFRPDDRVAINVLPQGITTQPVSIGTLGDALDEATKLAPLDWESIYSHINQALWQEELNT
jgi:hypothetical protein